MAAFFPSEQNVTNTNMDRFTALQKWQELTKKQMSLVIKLADEGVEKFWEDEDYKKLEQQLKDIAKET